MPWRASNRMDEPFHEPAGHPQSSAKAGKKDDSRQCSRRRASEQVRPPLHSRKTRQLRLQRRAVGQRLGQQALRRLRPRLRLRGPRRGFPHRGVPLSEEPLQRRPLLRRVAQRLRSVPSIRIRSVKWSAVVVLESCIVGCARGCLGGDSVPSLRTPSGRLPRRVFSQACQPPPWRPRSCGQSADSGIAQQSIVLNVALRGLE